MAGILYNQRSAGSGYNFKDDVQMLLTWIEQLRVVNGGDLNEFKTGTIYIEGNIDLAQVNRVRRAAGMKELDQSPELKED